MGAVEMKLGITGAPVDVGVSMQINLAAMLEDPARSFPAMARILGALLVEEYRLATSDMSENDTN